MSPLTHPLQVSSDMLMEVIVQKKQVFRVVGLKYANVSDYWPLESSSLGSVPLKLPSAEKVFQKMKPNEIPVGMDVMDHDLWIEISNTLPHPDVVIQKKKAMIPFVECMKSGVDSAVYEIFSHPQLSFIKCEKAQVELGGGSATTTSLPFGDLDQLLVISALIGHSFSMKKESMNLYFDDQIVPIGALVSLSNRLMENMKSIVENQLPEEFQFLMKENSTGVTIESKDGLLECDVLPAFLLMDGQHVTIGRNGTIRYSPTNLIRIAISEGEKDYMGMCAMVRMIKMLYFETVDMNQRVPSSIILALVYHTFYSISQDDVSSTSISSFLMKLKGFAIRQGYDGGKLELPGDPKINVLEWTTSEHYQEFVAFLV